MSNNPLFFSSLFAAGLAFAGVATAQEPQKTSQASKVLASKVLASELLAPVFQDHAVLQRDRPVIVWGHAEPGTRMTVRLDGAEVVAKADKSGAWIARLAPMAAGGPYTLDVRTGSGAHHTVQDVLIGDVYLCAGQSNMALPVSRSQDYQTEISESQNNTIRMLNIPVSAAPSPREKFVGPVGWVPAAPATTGNFSATCYYFARELQKVVPVPLGLINASSGGSNIRSWLNEPALRSLGGFSAPLDIEKLYGIDQASAMVRWAGVWQGWWQTQDASHPWADAWDAAGWQNAPTALPYWTEWNVPQLEHHTGLLWYRAKVTVPTERAGQPAVLSLGTLNEEDITWVGGKAVGASFGFAGERRYRIPAGVLKAGSNIVVVNVLCTYRGCGVFGPGEKRYLQFDDGTMLSLARDWQYRLVPDSVGPSPRAPWGATAGLSTAYNAMMAPLGPVAIRGALWYQGESNTGETTYKDQLSALIEQWRGTFGKDLPVLIVQLPNYGTPPTEPGASGWATLREAQRRVAEKIGHAGLAVTIDIGTRGDLHPTDKQDVGRRLARVARHVVYGEAVAPSGPVSASAERVAGGVAVTFADVTGALVAYGADMPIGFEVCSASGACHYATAHIDGKAVRLDIPAGLDAAKVRYCWADSPICTLYDRSGLPAGPFERRIEP